MLKDAQTIAVIGLSPNPERSSYGVAEYLTKYFRVIPVNPNIKEWNGLTCYPTLSDIPADIKIDIVDIFRRAEETPEIVKEAINRNVKGIWLQQGIISETSKTLAEKAGIPFIMDACIAVVHAQSK